MKFRRVWNRTLRVMGVFSTRVEPSSRPNSRMASDMCCDDIEKSFLLVLESVV